MDATSLQPERRCSWRLDRHPPSELESLVQRQLDEERLRRLERGARLHCVQCGAPITAESERIVMAGHHQHRVRNPHELVFLIGCFASAPGCTQQGAASYAWTWFPGYSWQVAVCAGCQVHLGWWYQGGSESFYGLILSRLIRRDA